MKIIAVCGGDAPLMCGITQRSNDRSCGSCANGRTESQLHGGSQRLGEKWPEAGPRRSMTRPLGSDIPRYLLMATGYSRCTVG
jgi:hypothetical protein